MSQVEESSQRTKRHCTRHLLQTVEVLGQTVELAGTSIAPAATILAVTINNMAMEEVVHNTCTAPATTGTVPTIAVVIITIITIMTTTIMAITGMGAIGITTSITVLIMLDNLAIGVETPEIGERVTGTLQDIMPAIRLVTGRVMIEDSARTSFIPDGMIRMSLDPDPLA